MLTNDEELRSGLVGSEDIFRLLCGASGVRSAGSADELPENCVSSVITGATIYMPLSELVDTAKERERLQSEKDRLLAELRRSEGMLSNEKFLSKAPAAKVEEEKQKKVKYEEMLRSVEERLSAL